MLALNWNQLFESHEEHCDVYVECLNSVTYEGPFE